jgi:hypothetical protein
MSISRTSTAFGKQVMDRFCTSHSSVRIQETKYRSQKGDLYRRQGSIRTAIPVDTHQNNSHPLSYVCTSGCSISKNKPHTRPGEKLDLCVINKITDTADAGRKERAPKHASPAYTGNFDEEGNCLYSTYRIRSCPVRGMMGRCRDKHRSARLLRHGERLSPTQPHRKSSRLIMSCRVRCDQMRKEDGS